MNVDKTIHSKPISPESLEESTYWEKIAVLALWGIGIHLFMRYSPGDAPEAGGTVLTNISLWIVLGMGSIPLLQDLRKKVWGKFGVNVVIGIVILVTMALREYLAGAFVVLMFSGVQVLKNLAQRNQSSCLDELANQVRNLVSHREETTHSPLTETNNVEQSGKSGNIGYSKS